MTIDALIEKHFDKTDLHITRVMGAFVVVSAGQIVEIDRTNALKYCPLQTLTSGKTIEEYICDKMRQFGHFTADREIMRSSPGVPFGTSEMFMYALRKKVIDCAVVVCDGAGTVVTSDPEIVQGIGARMNGLFYTTPIREVQEKLRQNGCIISDNAKIDQIAGLHFAIEAGYKRIGMTVNACYGENLVDIRKIERQSCVEVSVAAICSTGIEQERAEEIAKHTDLTWSCASKYMREVGRNALIQITLGIPIFVYTSKGIDIVAAYSNEEGAVVLNNVDSQKQYLLSSASGDWSILLGKRRLLLSETALPVSGKHVPVPQI